MPRALLAMDTAARQRANGDAPAAAEMAAAVLHRLRAAYRQGMVRSRAEALHRQLAGRRPRSHLDRLAFGGNIIETGTDSR
ncbi:hypothetical protein [Streptomyces sp. NPDC058718]|uniref:hypothetical protein n=1 Tax=Streptomyces sp. NPDC058718 TaxID=3346610 RepID=UPI0036CE93D1